MKTKIGIIFIDEKRKAENDRLIEEIKKEKIQYKIFYLDLFSIFIQKNKIEIFYNNKKINPQNFNCFVFRFKYGQSNYDKLSLLRFIEGTGVKVFNSAESIFITKDKRETLLKLSISGLSIIPTGINYSAFLLDQHLNRNKNNKFVVKINTGDMGQFLSILDSKESFVPSFELLTQYVDPTKILIQPYIESGFEDYRLIIIGNKVITAMKRKSNGFDFRANISKGGSGQKIKPTKTMVNLAIKAVKILKLDYAGVDIIKDRKGKLMIVEVNANPGLKIEQITNTNVAGEILKYCIKKSK